MYVEKEMRGVSGWLALIVLIVMLGLLIWALVNVIPDGSAPAIVGLFLLLLVDLVCFYGLTVVNPNEARVVILFGANAFDIDSESFAGNESTFENLGGNLCGCPDATEPCQVLEGSGLAA